MELIPEFLKDGIHRHGSDDPVMDACLRSVQLPDMNGPFKILGAVGIHAEMMHFGFLPLQASLPCQGCPS